MKKIIFAVMIVLLFSACNKGTTNKTEQKKDFVSGKEGNETSSNNVSEIPNVENSRLHIENNKLIKIDNIYEKEEQLVLPDTVTSIDRRALQIDVSKEKFTTSQTLHFVISNNIRLTNKNFRGAGPMKITFQKGRNTIEKGAFREAGCNGRCFSVTLPKSCKTLEKYAFYDYHGKLFLNDGLVTVKDWSLYTTTCDLPDSIEYLGKHALEDWSQLTKGNSGKYSMEELCLPLKLKVIEDNCLSTTDYPKNPIYIPSGVRYIGKDAISWNGDSEETKDKIEFVFRVDEKNKWYYNDEKGVIKKYS